MAMGVRGEERVRGMADRDRKEQREEIIVGGGERRLGMLDWDRGEHRGERRGW